MGCILASMLFVVPLFFNGLDERLQLVKITETLGTENLRNYLSNIGKKISWDGILSNKVSRKDLSKEKNNNNKMNLTKQSLDLIDRIFQFDPKKRITSSDALKHEMFK